MEHRCQATLLSYSESLVLDQIVKALMVSYLFQPRFRADASYPRMRLQRRALRGVSSAAASDRKACEPGGTQKRLRTSHPVPSKIFLALQPVAGMLALGHRI